VILTLLAGGTAGAQQPAAVTVDIRDFAFEPHEIKVAAGTTVRWVNRDPIPHQVAMEGGHPGSSPLLGPGGEHAAAFRNASRFTYRCGVHPTMLGVIIVD
jgi:plastocyanin